MTSGSRMISYISQDLSSGKVITDPTDLFPSPGLNHQMLRLQQPMLLLRFCEFSYIYLSHSHLSPPTLHLHKLCFSSHTSGWQPELVAVGRGRAAGSTTGRWGNGPWAMAAPGGLTSEALIFICSQSTVLDRCFKGLLPLTKGQIVWRAFTYLKLFSESKVLWH